MSECLFTQKASGVPVRHPAKRRRYSTVAPSCFADIVSASRGTRPLPLHPLPSPPFRSRGQRRENPCQPVDTDRGSGRVGRVERAPIRIKFRIT
jgi:hypothetical protein